MYTTHTLVGNSERARGISFSLLILILKYETIVSTNGVSLWYSERDTSSMNKIHQNLITNLYYVVHVQCAIMCSKIEVMLSYKRVTLSECFVTILFFFFTLFSSESGELKSYLSMGQKKFSHVREVLTCANSFSFRVRFFEFGLFGTIEL